MHRNEIVQKKPVSAIALPALKMRGTSAFWWQADAQLDEALDSLAHQFRGTAFLRTPIADPRSPVLAQLGLLCGSGVDLTSDVQFSEGCHLLIVSSCFLLHVNPKIISIKESATGRDLYSAVNRSRECPVSLVSVPPTSHTSHLLVGLSQSNPRTRLRWPL